MNEVIACKTCGLLQRLDPVPSGCQAVCARCSDTLTRTVVSSRTWTLAFALAALFLYVPANIYPLMIMEYMGRHSENTVWGGVRALYEDHMWYVAIIVFLASIIVPFMKLIGLFFLVLYRGSRWQKSRTWVYKVVCHIGPWAMLDVFLLSILVALIRFGRFAHVIAGPGIYAFATVVVLTLLASSSFDPQLIWKSPNSSDRHEPKPVR
jgi:paraquat-inducible protein A